MLKSGTVMKRKMNNDLKQIVHYQE